jgi:tRNA (guanine-N7-)-methyltransferase
VQLEQQMTQRIIPITSPNFIADRTPDKPLDWSAIFGNDHPLALEIGCGIGHFILEQARKQPEINFLAIDFYNKGCLKTCAKIDAAGLENVRVMRVEARWLLDKGLQPESLAAVYINCPDPWPKKRHRNRRLVNREFLLTLAQYLMPGGSFFFSTDFDNYAIDVAAQIRDLTGYRNMLQEDLVTTLPGYPISKYMQRFLDKNQNIYFIHYQRDAAIPRHALPTPVAQSGYRFGWQKAEND